MTTTHLKTVTIDWSRLYDHNTLKDRYHRPSTGADFMTTTHLKTVTIDWSRLYDHNTLKDRYHRLEQTL